MIRNEPAPARLTIWSEPRARGMLIPPDRIARYDCPVRMPPPGANVMICCSRAVVAALLCAAMPLSAQTSALGVIDFPTSGRPSAQPHFIRGVLLLHSFEYEDAARAFREAQEADPDLAIAYWGEAMTYNHPVWMQQDSAAARAVLARLGATTEARLARVRTPREREWLLAAEALYGAGGKQERDFRYADAMRRLYEANPGDHETAVFYALALLGTAHGGRDFATYMRAAAIAAPVFAANPHHPGAAHILIHSFDDPVHAPLGLPAARAYASIAPAAGHAQHMTSHIFVALGMWDDVVSANERARAVQDARNAKLGRAANVCGHYASWLQYGYLQQGRHREAASLMEACHTRVRQGGTPAEMMYFADMRARYVLDTQDWAAADRWSIDLAPGHARMIVEFTTAFAALERGDPAPARKAAAHLEQSAADRPAGIGIHGMELRALVLLHDGRSDEAIALLRDATEAEEALPYEFGPPAIVKPTHELLGEVLLETGRVEEARAAFRHALLRTPLRVAALEGASVCAKRMGDEAGALELAAQLKRIRARADETAMRNGARH